MNRKISLGTALTVMLIVAAVSISLTMGLSWSAFNQTVADVAERQAMYEKLDEIDQIFRQNCLFELDEEELQRAIARGYVSGTGDRYAAYLTQDQSENRTTKYEGKSYGIGLSCVRYADSEALFVTLVHEGSPAEEAGLRAGDVIIAVDGVTAEEAGYDKTVERIQGKEDTPCVLSVAREEQMLEITANRAEYTSTTVSGRMVDGVGVIRIYSFASNTAEQFQRVYHSLSGQGAEGLVIDLRNNLGGTLDSTERILDFLLPEGNLYTTVYKDGREEKHPSDANCVNLPMAVLVNGNSASASELLAGAMQDFGAAKLVGTKTYGKGVMQNTYTLRDKSSVVLTFAYFDLPNGENYDGVGITPNCEVALSEEQTKRFYQLTDEEDPQFQEALRQVREAAQPSDSPDAAQ